MVNGIVITDTDKNSISISVEGGKNTGVCLTINDICVETTVVQIGIAFNFLLNDKNKELLIDYISGKKSRIAK